MGPAGVRRHPGRAARRRRAPTPGAAPPASTGCAAAAAWPSYVSCGRARPDRPAAGPVARAGCCPTRRSSRRRGAADARRGPHQDRPLHRPGRPAPRWRMAARHRPGPGAADADLPESSAPAGDGPPPAHRWAERDPDAAKRLTAARAAVAALADKHHMPTENLLHARRRPPAGLAAARPAVPGYRRRRTGLLRRPPLADQPDRRGRWPVPWRRRPGFRARPSPFVRPSPLVKPSPLIKHCGEVSPPGRTGPASRAAAPRRTAAGARSPGTRGTR